MKRTTTWLVTFGLVGAYFTTVAACQEDNPGELLTVNSGSTTVASGMGGLSDGGGGETADGGGGSGGDPSTVSTGGGGQGGQGGEPEQPINGCLSTNAIDMTTMEAVALESPAVSNPECIRLEAPVNVDFVVAAPTTSHRVMHGEVVDGVGESVDPAASPFSPGGTHYCPYTGGNPPYNCGDMPAFDILSPGVYPFYDDFNKTTVLGVLYVE